MAEEEKKEQAPAEPQTAEEYAAAIKHLKENTVSKEAYEKEVAEKKTLIKALSGEGPVPEGIAQKAQKSPDIKELRKKFLNAGEANLTNAETVQLALDLRQACLDKGEPDPFLPMATKKSPTVVDIEAANRVAEAFQSWLDSSKDENGVVDNDVFNAYLKKGIAEDGPIITAKLKALEQAQKRKK